MSTRSQAVPASAAPGALIVTALALLAVGVVMVASATMSADHRVLAWPLWQTMLGRQILFVVAGVGVMLITPRLAPHVFASATLRRRCAYFLAVLVIAGLVAAWLPGLMDPHRASNRWVRLSSGENGLRFQPSELAKVALPFLLAAILVGRETDVRLFRRAFLPAALGTIAITALVMKADLSTAVLLSVVAMATMYVAGCRVWHLLLLALGGVGLGAWRLLTSEFRMERVASFLGWIDEPARANYQPDQSLVTIASGGWFGAGLGAGVQKYGYLPEAHTDFLFSIICEETGIFGAALVVGLFCTFVWLGIGVVRAASSPFTRVLAFGLTATIGLQAAMNIAVATVVVPTTGISLPLISAGGSGTLSLCLAVGLLAAIARESACHGQASVVMCAAHTEDKPERARGWSLDKGAEVDAGVETW